MSRRTDLDKHWEDFVVEIVGLFNKNCQVIVQLDQTLVELKNAVNPYGLPYGYSDRKE